MNFNEAVYALMYEIAAEVPPFKVVPKQEQPLLYFAGIYSDKPETSNLVLNLVFDENNQRFIMFTVHRQVGFLDVKDPNLKAKCIQFLRSLTT